MNHNTSTVRSDGDTREIERRLAPGRCMHSLTSTRTRTRTHAHTHTYTHTHLAPGRASIHYEQTRTHVHACTYACMHTHARARAHTHTYTHTLGQSAAFIHYINIVLHVFQSRYTLNRLTVSKFGAGAPCIIISTYSHLAHPTRSCDVLRETEGDARSEAQAKSRAGSLRQERGAPLC
jgi:hypothetical protein